MGLSVQRSLRPAEVRLSIFESLVDRLAPLWIRGEEDREATSWSRYEVAGVPLWSSTPLPELVSFFVSQEKAAAPGFSQSAPEPTSLSGSPAHEAADGGVTIFDGSGLLARGRRRVHCRLLDGAYRIEVEGCGSLQLSASGRELRYSVQPGLGDDERAELLLGPGLLLALALRGVFCFHSSAALSAVLSVARVAAFVGDSGRGKSTLASLLGRRPRMKLVADDLLPFSAATAEVLPQFPQLKWAAAEQAGSSLPRRLPLGAVFLLDGGAHCRTVEARRLSSRHAAQVLLRHTVAARLFTPLLLARHFSALSNLAEHLPVFVLRYPWNPDALAAVEEVVLRRLAVTTGG